MVEDLLVSLDTVCLLVTNHLEMRGPSFGVREAVKANFRGLLSMSDFFVVCKVLNFTNAFPD